MWKALRAKGSYCIFSLRTPVPGGIYAKKEYTTNDDTAPSILDIAIYLTRFAVVAARLRDIMKQNASYSTVVEPISNTRAHTVVAKNTSHFGFLNVQLEVFLCARKGP